MSDYILYLFYSFILYQPGNFNNPKPPLILQACFLVANFFLFKL